MPNTPTPKPEHVAAATELLFALNVRGDANVVAQALADAEQRPSDSGA